MVSISRWTVRSVACPQIRWFTSTTGAMAHCPKHATVRTVNMAIRSGEQEFVGLVPIGLAIMQAQAQFKPRTLQKVARTTGVAGGPAADADRVLALRLQD